MKTLEKLPEDEELVWQGQPDIASMPKRTMSGSDLVMLVLVAAIMVFLLFTIGPTLAGSFAGLALWMVIIAAMAAMLWFFKGGRQRMEMNRLSKLTYALGKNHMYVFTKRAGKAPKVHQFLITKTDKILWNGDSPGTIALYDDNIARAIPDSAVSNMTYYSRFVHIADAAKVHQLMLDIQNRD